MDMNRASVVDGLNVSEHIRTTQCGQLLGTRKIAMQVGRVKHKLKGSKPGGSTRNPLWPW